MIEVGDTVYITDEAYGSYTITIPGSQGVVIEREGDDVVVEFSKVWSDWEEVWVEGDGDTYTVALHHVALLEEKDKGYGDAIL